MTLDSVNGAPHCSEESLEGSWFEVLEASRYRRQMQQPTFRRATHNDAAAVVDIVQRAYRGESSRVGWTTEADLIEGQRTDTAMVNDTINRADAFILLAEHSGVGDGHRLVGCAELSTFNGKGGGGYFGMFAVDPALQGQGIGGVILNEIERLMADDLGFERLVLLVISLRVEMIDLYTRRGYVPTGDTVKFPYGDERYGRPTRNDLELLVMAKSLITGT
ncbi:MAG: GNAT family N-acetyltransferase [Acidimicrobiales bacterium]